MARIVHTADSSLDLGLQKIQLLGEEQVQGVFVGVWVLKTWVGLVHSCRWRFIYLVDALHKFGEREIYPISTRIYIG